MSELLLTPEQQAIVAAPLGHYVVRAVAGSGKTTTLAYRIKALLDRGLDARRILVLMFNKSAQLDFQAKLNRIITQGTTPPEVRTFHAMGFRLYRRFIELGALPTYQGNILSEREIQFHLLQLVGHTLSGEQQLEFKRYKKEYLDVAARFIDQCKGQLDDPKSFFNDSGLDQKFSFLPQLFERFEDWRLSHRRISYADMLYAPVMTMRANPELQKHVENKMDVVLVDEYQDTNDIQHALLSIITGSRAQVTIVGDPDQTIYEFRGAKPKYMVSGFAAEHPDCERLSLSTSFRYGHQVALLANQLIAHSPYHDHTLCVPSEQNPHTHVELLEAHNELKQITNTLEAQRSDIATSSILVRYWSQTAAIELGLLKANIPYTILGYRGIFGSDEMLALRAILELASGVMHTLSNQERERRFLQIARFPHVSINERQIASIMYLLAEHDSRWGNHLISLIPEQLSRYQKLKLERLARAFSAAENNTQPPEKLFERYILETNLYEELKSSGLSKEASEEQVRTVKSLIGFMVGSQERTAEQLLNTLSELELKTENAQQDEGVLVTSVHRAKGLEWDRVILPGLSESNVFARGSRKELSEQDIASERRLLYVAMTRARKHLSLLYPAPAENDTLRFIREMQTENTLSVAKAIEQESSELKLKQTASKLLSDYATRFGLVIEQPATSSHANAGTSSHPAWTMQHVMHRLLGKGMVVKEEAETFTVEFEDKERRVFSKRYADQVFETA